LFNDVETRRILQAFGRRHQPLQRLAEPRMTKDLTVPHLPREIAVRYGPIIRRAAHRMARRLPSHVCVDDLVGAGFVGLVKAYRQYDAARCDRFEPYAELRIRGAMLDELRSHDPLPRDLRAMLRKANMATRGLQTQLGRTPTDAEVAGQISLPLETYRHMRALTAFRSISIHVDANDDWEAPVEFDDPSAIPPDEELSKADLRRAVALAIEALPRRLRRVLELYYCDDLTMRDIGGLLGVTESRVCQLRAEAIKLLRASMGEPPRVCGLRERRDARTVGGSRERRDARTAA
jgi:RNA polymerase sigma factor FliA